MGPVPQYIPVYTAETADRSAVRGLRRFSRADRELISAPKQQQREYNRRAPRVRIEPAQQCRPNVDDDIDRQAHNASDKFRRR